MIHFQDKVSFIWSIAEILRGPYKPEDYGKVVLPLAVLRRFDCVLESTKEEVLTSYEKFKHLNEDAREPILNRVNAVNFYKKMKKSLGNKRNEITDEQIEEIVRLYGDFKEGDRHCCTYCKISFVNISTRSEV
ncbi:Type I restriction-modification system, DNA-methyltransferase subunit M [Caldibacillus thermoamylovorans]|uniref:type I restriction-modification system subunit M N-terminal domain-containing protein n=1 Tax=Caldibacillus thermoamylovorans TaxID=35841 RepID=UPI0005A42825|nr:type I restriction-modification system subunit M N-terminal domain-containing protein [Caldibacillus thermoamylovorans]KIO58370.1 Type I restriction-modification system, DNA-methyltransferase subunit M [Caldibacillus thermoamylovorans]